MPDLATPSPPLDGAIRAEVTRTGRGRIGWAGWLALLPSLLLLAIVVSPPINHDAAAVLEFATRWLKGERLYLDLLDVNPPLVFLLHLPPAALALLTPVGPAPALVLWVLLLCALSVWLALRVLRLDATTGPVERGCLLAALPLLTLAAGYDFAQREHLMTVAALPWLLLAARRAEGTAPPAPRGLALGVTLLAALGFALKPHFLAIPALVEALVLAVRWRRGARGAALLADPLPWVMAAVWGLYLAAIPILFSAYVGTVLPLVVDHYLALGGLTWWQTLLTERLGTALLALLPLAAVAFLAPLGALPRVLALAGLGAALAAVVQSKGWTYHALPVRLLAGLLAVVLAARWMDRVGLAPARAARAAPGMAAIAAFALMLHALAGAEAPWRQITWGWSRAGLLAEAISRVAPQGRVLVLSPDIFPVWPALTHAGAESTLPTMNLWLLQGAYAECPPGGAPRTPRAPAAMPPAERLLFRSVVEEFAADPPEAVLVSRNPGIPDCGGAPFDLIGYFARDPRFAATFRRYRPVRDLAVEGYQLYRREF